MFNPSCQTIVHRTVIATLAASLAFAAHPLTEAAGLPVIPA